MEHRAGGAADEVRWHQVVVDGRIAAWSLGPLASADVVLRWTHNDALALLAGTLWGSDAVAKVAVLDPTTNAPTAPPPMDIAATPALDELAVVPGATLTVQYHFGNGPFGPVEYWWRFQDGRSAGMGLATAAAPDVEVWIDFRSMVDVRRGRITILEALAAGGRVAGPAGALMLLAGLEESDEVRAAEAQCNGDAGAVLAAMGELACSAPYREAMAQAFRSAP